jgi:four helix bundle protein
MKPFRDLKVWQKAHEITLQVYEITGKFPNSELYGLTSQIRRCAASIPANIAEGCGRSGDAELARYCQIAMGSASELEYHILLAKDLRLINNETYEVLDSKVVEVKKILAVFINKLHADR